MTDSRIPLVFLPGLLNDARLWQPVADLLADIAEPWIADLTQDDSIAAMASRVLAWAPERFALAGLSMGGYVALEMMRQAPERIIKLALLDTSAAPDSAGRRAQRQAGIDSLQLGRFVGVTNKMLPQIVHPSRLTAELGGLIQDMAAVVGADGFIRQQSAILGRIDSRPHLAAIQVPTLVGVGDSDMLTSPREALEIHKGIEGSTLHVFANCGHLPALEVPGETAFVLREWLGAPVA